MREDERQEREDDEHLVARPRQRGGSGREAEEGEAARCGLEPRAGEESAQTAKTNAQIESLESMWKRIP